MVGEAKQQETVVVSIEEIKRIKIGSRMNFAAFFAIYIYMDLRNNYRSFEKICRIFEFVRSRKFHRDKSDFSLLLPVWKNFTKSVVIPVVD